MPANTHAHHFSLFKPGFVIDRLRISVGYKWQAIYHVVYKDNSSAQVDSCCILFEYSIMHAHEGTSGTRVLTRDIPASIIRVKSFACTRSAKRG